MTGIRTVWINGEPVAVPDFARVVHVDGERHAMIAVPTWRVVILTEAGSIEAPDGLTNAALLRDHFPGLAESSLPAEPTRF